MNRKKIVKILIILFIFISSFSLVVFLYNRNHKTAVLERKVEKYTECLNSITSSDKYLITVGSNNHNLNKFDKAAISKYDLNKNKILEKVYNKGYNSTYYDVLKDGNDYVVVGSYESTKNELENKIRTAFIVKYDKDFNILFENEFPVISDSYFKSIIKVDDGYIVCGKSNSINKKDNNSGPIIVKYDLNGNEIFIKYTKDINSTYNDIVYLNGYIYVCGDNTISCYDLLGNLINLSKYNNVKFTNVISGNDKLYLCGTLSDNNNNKGIIVSYDMNLSIVNEVIYDKYSDVQFKKLLFDEDCILVIGDTYYNDDDEKISDGLIGKYTYDLKEKSVVRYNVNRNIKFNDLIKKDDKYIVIGYYNNDDNINSKFLIFSSSLKNLGS